MGAAKELHDATREASMARRHDPAGWIPLHPGGRLPDTYAPLLLAKVLSRHVDLAPAVKALRTAAKSNWTQGCRAWGPGCIKLQLVRQGDPGHKGERHFVWVNVATRDSTTSERELETTLKLSRANFLSQLLTLWRFTKQQAGCSTGPRTRSPITASSRPSSGPPASWTAGGGGRTTS